MAILGTPDERFRDLPGYPFEPRYVELGGLRMHHIDEGAGATVLLVHGEPSWSEGGGHFLQEDCGEALARVVIDFVR